MLTGSRNLVKYLQFNDPYGVNPRNISLPEELNCYLKERDGQSFFDKFILDNKMGLRLLMVGSK
tara:strand:+ start:262 stop:453 length:192 start_codon:yes stop_codon:yes gene_type:complete